MLTSAFKLPVLSKGSFDSELWIESCLTETIEIRKGIALVKGAQCAY